MAASTPDPSGSLSTPESGTGSSRRRFLVTAVSAAAATAAVAAVPGIADASPSPQVRPASGPATEEPVVVYVSHARTGELSVYSGEKETKVTDKVLARHLARLAP